MSSQRHFLYLLPRADPEELDAATEDDLPPCTCSHRVDVDPPAPAAPPSLRLKVRIPPRAGPTSSSSSPSASTSTSTRKNNSQSVSSSSSHGMQSYGHPPISSPVSSASSSLASPPQRRSASDGTAAAAGSSEGRKTSSYSQRTPTTPSYSHSQSSYFSSTSDVSRSASNPAQSTSASPAFPADSYIHSRGSKHQFISWKLIAPQVKTLSASSNTYLLDEAFPRHRSLSSSSLMSSTSSTSSSPTLKNHGHSRGNSLVAQVHDLMHEDKGTAISQLKIPLPSPAPSDGYEHELHASTAYQARTLSAIPSTLSTIQESGHSDDGRSERSAPSLTTTTAGTGTSSSSRSNSTAREYAASSTSDAAGQTNTASRLKNSDESSGSDSRSGSASGSASGTGSGSASGSAETCSTPETVLSPVPPSQQPPRLPCPRHSKQPSPPALDASSAPPPPPTSAQIARSTSSSTISSVGTSMSRTASTSSRRTIPAAYRKEMESVLFAQTGNSSTPSAKSPANSWGRRSTSGDAGSCSSAAGNIVSTPSLASAIFSSAFSSLDSTSTRPLAGNGRSRSSSSRSSSTATSPMSSQGHSSISSLPFFLDAPKLVDTRKIMMEYQNDPFYIASGNCNVIYVNDLTWYLEKVLWKLGMHRKGRKEFMSYWLPRFANDDYVALRFLPQNEIEAFSPLYISVVSDLPNSSYPNPATHLELASPTKSTSPPSQVLIRPSYADRQASNQSISSVWSDNDLSDGYNTSCSLSTRSISNASTAPSLCASSLEKQQAMGEEISALSEVHASAEYTLHRIHVLFQRLKPDEIQFFQHRVKYRSGSSTEGVIDWSEMEGIKPTDEAKREDIPKLLHVSATDLGHRGLYYH